MPLVASELYAPYVVYGSSGWHPGTAEGSDVTHQLLPAYAVLGVEEGVHRLDTGGRRHRLHAGAVAVLRPHVDHQHRVAPSSRLLYAVFYVVAGGAVMTESRTQRPRRRGRLKVQPDPEQVWGMSLPIPAPDAVAPVLMRELRLLCDNWWRGWYGRARANHHLAVILDTLVRACSVAPGLALGGPRGNQPPTPNTDELVAQAEAMLVGRRPPQTVEDWARLVGLHRGRFTRRFTAARGESPGSYLRRVRLRRAEALLRMTEDSLQLIAYEAGYRDTAAMAHTFRMAHGCTPTAWRTGRR